MLKVAALVFLLLSVMAFEAAGAEGSSGVPMREIDAGEILAKIQAGQPVEYDHVVVRGDLDLSWENIEAPIRINDSTFDGSVSFNTATFEQRVNLEGSNFTRDADFLGATFSGNTDFSKAKFSKDAEFWKATFSKYANFLATTFSGGATFRRNAFSENANFAWAKFREDADFRMATFKEDAGFHMATFNGNSDFSEAKFSEVADFRMATFSGFSSFREADFNQNIEFENVVFKNNIDFYRILFKRPAYFENCYIESLNLTKAEYSRLYLRWDDIKSLHFDEAAYLALIKNYNNLGWYGDANNCYYAYRNAVRKNWQAASSPGFAAWISNLLDRLIDFGEWLLYGYGVMPSFPIAWSVGIILAFALLFRLKRCLRKIIVEERIEDSKEGSDEVQIKTTARRAEIGALDPLLFSLFTFTSGFTSFLHPGIEYKLERCVRWAIAERLLGPFFMALVITTISKTYLIR